MTFDDDDVAKQICCEMQEVRRELRGNIESIATQARQLTDWKYYVQQTPWLAVGLAAFAGYSAVPSRTKPPERDVAIASSPRNSRVTGSPLHAANTVKAGSDGITGFAKRLIVAGLSRSVMNFVAGQVAEIFDSSTKSKLTTSEFADRNGRNRT